MSDRISKVLGRVPLRTIIVVPFIILIIIAISMTGYLSYQNSQQAVNDVTSQLRNEITSRIEDNLHNFLGTAYTITNDNQDAIDLGMLSMHDLPAWKSYLWHKVKNDNSISISATGNEGGEYFGVDTRENGQVLIQVADQSTGFNILSYDTNREGNTTLLLTGTHYDPRIRPWYTAPARLGKPAWTPIYQQHVDPVLQIALGVPIYNQQGRLQGVTAGGFHLSKISTFLEGLKVGKTGETYIVENSGLLVAASNKELPFIVQGNGTTLRIRAVESRDPLIRESAAYIEDQSGGFASINGSRQLDFEIAGQRQFVQVTHFRDEYGLDWKIVVVMPEADFMDQIRANNRTTLFLMGAALIGAILSGIFISRWVTRPIIDLNNAAKSLAAGTWDHAAPVDRIDEVGELATSFNKMAGQIQKNLSDLKRQVDELRRAEEALRESEEKYRSLVNNLNVGVYRSTELPPGKWIWANPAFLRIFGYESLEACINSSVMDIYFTPEDRIPLIRALSTDGFVQDFQVYLKKLDGTPIWISTTAQAKKSADGKIEWIDGISQDITDLKRAEESIKLSHDRFRTVMNSLDALVYVTDMQNYELLFVNEYGRKIWGDITGNTCWKTLQAGQTGPCPFCTNSKLMDSSGNPNGVLVWEFLNTLTKRWYECRDSAISWVDGRMVRLEIAMDISDRKRAEEEIFHKNEELHGAYEEMIATAEELKQNYEELRKSQQALEHARKKLNLLNAVTFQDIQNGVFSLFGYFELGLLVAGDEKPQEYLTKQIAIVQKISETLKFAEHYQRLGLRPPTWQNVQQSFLMGISHLDASKILRKLNVNGLKIYADPLLEEVFFHLVQNVVLHGKTATEIKLSYQETEHGLVLVFEDNGAGIPAARKEKIFERRIEERKGLGLFLAREILEITGITIKETSEPGKGARFEITVPEGAYRSGSE